MVALDRLCLLVKELAAEVELHNKVHQINLTVVAKVVKDLRVASQEPVSSMVQEAVVV